MKVNLIKKAEFDLNESKCVKIPFDTFCKMASADLGAAHGNAYPTVRVFANIEEFKKSENFSDYDSTQDVLVHNNGQIFVTIKDYTEGLGNPSLSEDETTSAK